MGPYFTAAEVAQHNRPSDCWLSLLGSVYDVTEALRAFPGPLAEPLIAAAGTDVSHWFDSGTGYVKLHIHPTTGLPTPYCRQGIFLHMAPVAPVTGWDTCPEEPWWSPSGKYRIGSLTKCAVTLRIVNCLTGQEHFLQVPVEETLAEIRERVKAFNAHAEAYCWKALRRDPADASGVGEFADLDMGTTLEGNGLEHIGLDCQTLALDSSVGVPAIHLYWNDALTAA